MWISRAHYELIAERAREFRAWHEQRVKELEQAFAERLAERDTLIAGQERQIARLEEKTSEYLKMLFKREDQRNQPPEPLPPGPDDTWEAVMRKQIEEMNAPGSVDA